MPYEYYTEDHPFPSSHPPRGRVVNLGARRWRRVALGGMVVAFVLGLLVGVALTASRGPERPVRGIDVVNPAPTRVIRERASRSERHPLADVGGDGAAAVRER